MTTIDERFDAKVLRLRALLAEAKPRPWQWLDSGDEPGECDELQDGAGEMIATGFLDDIGLTTDGRLCAAAVNALPALLDVAEAAREYRKNQSIAARDALDAALARLEADHE